MGWSLYGNKIRSWSTTTGNRSIYQRTETVRSGLGRIMTVTLLLSRFELSDQLRFEAWKYHDEEHVKTSTVMDCLSSEEFICTAIREARQRGFWAPFRRTRIQKNACDRGSFIRDRNIGWKPENQKTAAWKPGSCAMSPASERSVGRWEKLPIGIENFKEFSSEDFYYVDKTLFIKELLQNWGKVNLFTRPRRFGKSLNMSMLKCFWGRERSGIV